MAPHWATMCGLGGMGPGDRRGLAGLPRHPGQGGKELGQAYAHVRHGRHHGAAQFGRQGADINEAALGARLVHAVEGKDHRPAQGHQFQRELQIPFQSRGIHHHQEYIGRGKDSRGQMGLMLGDGRPAITPQQILQRHLLVFVGGVKALDGGQGDQGDLIDAHLDQAFLIGGADTGQAFVVGSGAGGGVEDAVLTVAIPADNRHAGASGAPQGGSVEGEGRDRQAHGLTVGSGDGLWGCKLPFMKAFSAPPGSWGKGQGCSGCGPPG